MTYNLERFYRLEARHQQLAAAARDCHERVRAVRQEIAEIQHDMERHRHAQTGATSRRPIALPRDSKQLGAYEFVDDGRSSVGRLQSQLAEAQAKLQRLSVESAEASERAQVAGQLATRLREFLRSKGAIK